MLSKRYETTEVVERAYMCPRGLFVHQMRHSPSSRNTKKKRKKKKKICQDGYTILKSHWLNKLDHMHISGTEPSSVILSKTMKSDTQIMPKQVKDKRDAVINLHNYNFISFNT